MTNISSLRYHMLYQHATYIATIQICRFVYAIFRVYIAYTLKPQYNAVFQVQVA